MDRLVAEAETIDIGSRTIGRAIVAMGGGRLQVEDTIDPTVGFVISVKPGDKVLVGEPIASIYAKDANGAQLGAQALDQAIVIADRLAEPPLPLISHRVTKAGVEELTLTRPPRAVRKVGSRD